MYSLSDKQIDFILNDIRARGVETEDLQLNLLDHICCIIESELEENGDFGQFYRKTIHRFFRNELRELEEETQLLLTFKHYYTMKKIMFASGFFSAFLMLIGAYFKTMHWPLANVMLILGMGTLSLFFLPMMFTLKLREKKERRDKIVLLLGLFATVYLLIGALFKFMHWPGAGFFVLTGIPFLLFIFLPVYLVNGLKNPAAKVNTIVTAILIIAGSGFAIVLPNPTNIYNVPAKLNNLKNEEIILGSMRQMAEKDSGSTELHKVYNEFMASANDLKNLVTQLSAGMEYDRYIQDLAPNSTEAAYTTKLREFPETENYIASLTRFEERSGSKIYSYGNYMHVAPTRSSEIDYALISHPNVKDLLQTIINTQEQACLVLAKK